MTSKRSASKQTPAIEPVATETVEADVDPATAGSEQRNELPAVIAVVPSPDGWYSDADWITIECDWPSLKPREGAAPLTATIDATLTIKEASAIPLGIRPLGEVIPHITARVRSWNVMEFDAVTGTMVPVPPPAEIGVDAFTRCRPDVISWLASAIQNYSLFGGPNRKNGTTPSDPTSDGLSDDA